MKFKMPLKIRAFTGLIILVMVLTHLVKVF
nr:MAG TPA: hypothetical protein [Caudoviricetes sp.]